MRRQDVTSAVVVAAVVLVFVALVAQIVRFETAKCEQQGGNLYVGAGCLLPPGVEPQ